MKKIFVIISAGIFLSNILQAQSGNHIFAGAEAVNFGTIDLATPAGQTWSTFRGASPGYFSAVATATYNSSADAQANVDGYVKYYANGAAAPFTYPVGTGTDLRTLAISGAIPATAEWATAWIPGDPSEALDPTSTGAAAGTHSVTLVTAPITFVSTTGQWDWQDLSGNAAGTIITVSIPDESGFSVPDNLRLVGWNGTSWVDLSGEATASGNTENSTLSGTAIAGITAIGIGAILSPLPIKLISFAGVSNNCNGILNWATATETNAAEFVIQQSIDGINFKDVASVTAINNNSGNQYNYTIFQTQGVVYSRLKMVNLDGKTDYSSIVILQSNCNGKDYMTINPNPIIGESVTYLNFSSSYKGNASMVFTNTLGQQFLKQFVTIKPGVNVLPIHTQTLAAGTSFVTLISSEGDKIGTTQKVVKNN